MRVYRNEKGKMAIMALETDSMITEDAMTRIKKIGEIDELLHIRTGK